MSVSLRHFSSTDIRDRLPELGALLQNCVHDGASIGFILPFDTAASQAFWTDNVLPAVTRGVRLLLVAEVDGHDDDSLPSTEYPMIVSSSPEAGAAVNDCRTNAN